MQLLTLAIKRVLPLLGATAAIPLADKNVICKFFTPDANGCWSVFEGQVEAEDVIFFGRVHGIEQELGYFSLNELAKVRGPLGFAIERDITVFNIPYGSVNE